MQPKQRPKAADKGRYKLAIYFVDHQSSNGKPYYFYSNKRQDTKGTAINRLKLLVSKKWENKVNWAAIYEHDRMAYEFKDRDTGWETR